MFRKRYNIRRQVFAFLLLMAMALQVGVKAFHQHGYLTPIELACSDCDNHCVHNGHLLAWDGHSAVCPLCQLLQSPCDFTQQVAVAQAVTQGHTETCLTAQDLSETDLCLAVPRGPPCFFV